MAHYLTLTLVIVSALCMGTEAGGCGGTIADAASGLFSTAWSTFLPDSTKETCRVLGWRDTQPVQKGFFDNFVPQIAKAGMGLGFAAAFPAEMQNCFCKQAGMTKDEPVPQGGGIEYVYDPPTVRYA